MNTDKLPINLQNFARVRLQLKFVLDSTRSRDVNVSFRSRRFWRRIQLR